MSDAGKTRVVLPADVDILLGRGKPFQNHPGNQRMLGLVDKFRDRYQRAERKEKHDIVEEVMGIIRGSGGRFLRRVDYENYWVEVSHSIAYRKVGHAFRSKARKVDSSKKVDPSAPMSKQRVEAPVMNNNSNNNDGGNNMNSNDNNNNNNNNKGAVDEALLADLRMRRAALHQAELIGMSNFASLTGQSPLDRLLLPSAAVMGGMGGMGINPGMYGGLGAAGLMGGGGLVPSEHLLRQQNLLAANSAFMGNGFGNGMGGNGMVGNGMGGNGMGMGGNGMGGNGMGGNGMGGNGMVGGGMGGSGMDGNGMVGGNNNGAAMLPPADNSASAPTPNQQPPPEQPTIENFGAV